MGAFLFSSPFFFGGLVEGPAGILIVSFLEVDFFGVSFFLWPTSGFREAFILGHEKIRGVAESSELSSSTRALKGCIVT